MDYRQPNFYRFSEDSIWLANTAAKLVKDSPKNLLDIGSGCGVVGIELCNRIQTIKKLYLLEPQKEFLAFIESNKQMLKTKPTLNILNCTLSQMEEKGFDLIVSNPPYFQKGGGRESTDLNKQMCRTFINTNFLELFEQAKAKLNPKGQLFLLARSTNPNVKLVLSKYSKVLEVDRRGETIILNYSL